MKQITRDLNLLKEDDLVTIILFCLYKMTGDPLLSTISELAYTLDKESLYNLCSTFGGTTIKIPTLKEYKDMTSVMLVFELINSSGLTFAEACEELGIDPLDDKIITMYSTMNEVLESYEE